MITRLWNKWLVWRGEMWRKFAPLVYTRWYRALLLLVVTVVAVKFVDGQRGPDFPSPIGRIPVQVFTVPLFLLLLPFIVELTQSSRIRNARLYDSNAPEIVQIASRTRRIGRVFLLVSAIFLVGGLFIASAGNPPPVWVAIGPMAIFLVLGIMLIGRSNAMRAGTWNPPEWMPPMDLDDPTDDNGEDA